MTRVTRRRLLTGAGALAVVGAGGVLGVEEDWLPGRAQLHRALGLTGPDGQVPDTPAGLVVSGSFHSDARLGAEVGWSIVYPTQRRESLPVVVCLHGYGGSHVDFVNGFGGAHFLADAVRRGTPRFAVATVDGGGGYFHPDADGEDAGAMVTDELVPLLAKQGLSTDRIGFYGWSMGGYGALRLAGVMGARRVAAVAAASAALWQDYSGVPSHAFATADEYARYTLFGRQHELDGIDVSLDCGIDDPFYPADRAWSAGQPFRTSFTEGAHEKGYWQRMLPSELDFLGHRLGGPTS